MGYAIAGLIVLAAHGIFVAVVAKKEFAAWFTGTIVALMIISGAFFGERNAAEFDCRQKHDVSNCERVVTYTPKENPNDQ